MDLPPPDDSARSGPSESLIAEVDALSAMLPRATHPVGGPAATLQTDAFPDARLDAGSSLPTR